MDATKNGPLGLPAEIQNDIYFLALPKDQDYDLGKRQDYPENSTQYKRGVSPICQASQQLREEIIHIWGANNDFTIRAGSDTPVWPRSLLGEGLMSVPGIVTWKQLSLEDVPTPHYAGGFENTRLLLWSTKEGDSMMDGSKRLDFYTLTLNDNHCRIYSSRRFGWRETWSAAHTPELTRLTEARLWKMFTTLQRLLGRQLT